MSENIWNAINGKREDESHEVSKVYLIELVDKYLEEIDDEVKNEDNKNKLIEAIKKSSELTDAYALDYILRKRKKCEKIEEKILEKYDKGRKPEEDRTSVYDPLLGDFVSKTGKSKKSNL